MQTRSATDQRLLDRVAVVTGAGRPHGIGRAICRRFAEEGARVAVLDVDGAGARDVAAEILAEGGTAIHVVCDVRDLSDCEAAAARVASEWGGRVDILVNNAASVNGVVWQAFDEWSVDEWDQMLDVNLRGMWFCARAFVPLMKAGGYGKIINVSSSTFWEGVGGFIHYTSSKGGVIGFTRALGRELGECGIRVNALAPGYTMTDATVEHAAAHPAHRAAMREQRALKRDEVPEDIAGPAFFLASADSDFMTCQTILVDGGRSMR